MTLAGAQIPVELVDSWLLAARGWHFTTEQVLPVYLSQHGFEKLATGEADLACTDRPLAASELADFEGRSPRGRRVAFYGYALYVHPDNPLDAIYAGHLKLVFQQRMKDWKELAGDAVNWEGPIRLFGPSKESRGGSVLAPLARIWFAEATWQERDSDAAILAAVAQDPLALGFASIGYDGPARYLGLRMERGQPPAWPSLEEIESERYGLAKVIYVYISASPESGTEALLEYLFSDAGHQAMEETSVWPIPRERAAISAPQ